jgi:hypothetical protein
MYTVRTLILAAAMTVIMMRMWCSSSLAARVVFLFSTCGYTQLSGIAAAAAAVAVLHATLLNIHTQSTLQQEVCGMLRARAAMQTAYPLLATSTHVRALILV